MMRKNFNINGSSKQHRRKLTKNQTFIAFLPEINSMVIKTDNKFYKVPTSSLTEEEFNEMVKEENGEAPVPNVFHAKFNTGTTKNITLPIFDEELDVTVDWGDGTINGLLEHTYVADGIYDVKIDGEIRGWNYSYQWEGSGFTATDKIVEILNWGNFVVTFEQAFKYCSNLKLTNVIGVPTFETTTISEMFSNCTNLTTIKNINTWNTSTVTSMGGMFNYAISFNQSLSFDTSSLTNTGSMFRNATSFNSPITFDTSKVTNMYGMFMDAIAFNQPLAFNTSSVTNMGNMFEGASTFNQDLSSWDVSKVTNASDFATDATAWILPKPNFQG